jgi:hypothetical protein
VSDADLALMRRIDELHLDYPFAGSRMLQGLLPGEGRAAAHLDAAATRARSAQAMMMLTVCATLTDSHAPGRL